jgi:hypothetical protein
MPWSISAPAASCIYVREARLGSGKPDASIAAPIPATPGPEIRRMAMAEGGGPEARAQIVSRAAIWPCL